MRALTLILFLISFNCYATRWSIIFVEDPIGNGNCQANKLLSYGDYVYSNKSKYDLVFFPKNSFSSVWFCPDSGYISFAEDFYDINANERMKIKLFLDENYSRYGKDSFPYKLWLLEEVYKLRSKDEVFWVNAYHRFAVLAENVAGAPRDNVYPIMEKLTMRDDLPNVEKQKLYYWIGEWHRRGDDFEEAAKHYCAAKSIPLETEKQEMINGVVESRAALLPEELRACK